MRSGSRAWRLAEGSGHKVLCRVRKRERLSAQLFSE